MLLHFYAETKAMQNNIRAALERILGVPVEWRHIFEVMEEEGIKAADGSHGDCRCRGQS